MLLLDWWPLGRFQPRAPDALRKQLRPLVREKLPFFALSVCSSFITFIAQKTGGAVAALEKLPVDARISNAVVSYVRYIGKLLWPSDLAALYPYRSWPLLTVCICLLALAGITSLAIWQRNKKPYILVGWLWFLGTLVPVIGIVQVGAQSIADRYTYFPAIGVFMLLAWGAADLISYYRQVQWAAWVVGTSTLVALALAAQPQILRWQNSETLFRYTIAVTAQNSHAYNELGLYFAANREWKEAETCYRTAIAMDPTYAHPRNNLGCALIDQGRSEQAITNCQAALRLLPSFAEAHNNLATALVNCGRIQEGVQEYQSALQLQPDYVQAHYNLANALIRIGKIADAAREYQTAIALNPQFADARNNYAFMLLQEGQFLPAIAQFRAALALNPGLWQARCGLGQAFANQGQFASAAEQFTRVLTFRPDQPGARNGLEQCRKALASGYTER